MAVFFALLLFGLCGADVVVQDCIKFVIPSSFIIELVQVHEDGEILLFTDGRDIRSFQYDVDDPLQMYAKINPGVLSRNAVSSVELRLVFANASFLSNNTELLWGQSIDTSLFPEIFVKMRPQWEPSALQLPRVVRLDYARLGLISNSEFFPHPNFFLASTGVSVIDVGTACGHDYSVPMSSAGQVVFAFEPHPANQRCVREQVEEEQITIVYPGRAYNESLKLSFSPEQRQKGHIMLVAGAISDVSSEMYLNVHADEKRAESSSSFSLLPHVAVRSTVRVSTLRIDDLIDEDVFLFKTDTEGYEYHVIRGAEKLFRNYKIPYLVLEFSPYLLRAAGTDPLELLDYIHMMGYEIYHAGWDNFWLEDTPYEEYTRKLAREKSLGGYWAELVCVRRIWKGQFI